LDEADMSEPPETDLDYYSRPENYTGSSLRSLQKFTFAKQKQDKALTEQNKKTKKKKNGFDLFARYRHILKGFVSEEDDENEEDDEVADDRREDSHEKSKFEDIREDFEDSEGKSDIEEKVDQTVFSAEEEPSKSSTESDGRVVGSTSPFSHEFTSSPRDSITSTSPVPPKPRGQSDVSAVRSSLSLRFSKQQQINNELRTKAVSMYQI
jgi:hypothetical protein